MIAGLKAAASQLAVKTAAARGNVFKGLSRLREKGSVRTIFTSMAKAGLTSMLLGAAAANPDSLPQFFIDSAVKSTISMALDITVDGVKPSTAAKHAARQTITETVSRTISAQLGKLYHGGALPDGAHEVLHGASAYTIEKFRSGSSKKARSAAAGAISAEVFTKLYVSNAAVFSNPDATRADLDKAITTGIELARLTAASVATALKLDAEVAASAAEIAAQENGLSHVHYQKAQEAQEEALAMVEQQIENLQTLKGEGYVPTPEEVRASLSAYQKLRADLGKLGIIVTTPKELQMLESGRVKAVGVPAALAINKGSSLLLSAATHAMKLNKTQSVELSQACRNFVNRTKNFITNYKNAKIRQRAVEDRYISIQDAKKLGFQGDRIIRGCREKKGLLGVNTEKIGNMKEAGAFFRKVVRQYEQKLNQKATIFREQASSGGGRLEATFSNGNRVQLRPSGKSGHPKVEITDRVRFIEEKITFVKGKQ